MARSRAGREPLRDPGGEAQARTPRRGLSRVPRRSWTVGPLALGSTEVRALVGTADRHLLDLQREVSLRVETLKDALDLPDAIVQARLAA